MESILVAITPDSPLEKVEDKLKEWLGEGRHGKKVILLMVVEEELPSSVSSWLMYVGFLGGKVEDEMRRAIIDELRVRGQEILKEQKKKLEKIGVSFTLREKVGSVREVVKKAIEEFNPNKVIVSGIEREKIKGLNWEVL